MTEETITYCRVCEVYCGLVATVEDGRVTRLRPDDDHVASRGYICPKGAVFHEVTHDPDRVLHPLKRTEEGWQRISWEQAITEIAERLNRIRARTGPTRSLSTTAIRAAGPTAIASSRRAGSTLSAAGTRRDPLDPQSMGERPGSAKPARLARAEGACGQTRLPPLHILRPPAATTISPLMKSDSGRQKR